MHTLDDIQQAIARLPPLEREHILTWLSDAIDTNQVEEAAAPYDAEPERRRFSFEEYLAFEEASPTRHEYVNGIVYGMSGGSENHEFIAGNIFAAIHTHLHGRPCHPYKSDFKLLLQINRDEIVYYPDIMVACTREGAEKNLLRYPALIVEVLSPSTRSIDRREKRLNYTQIPTLQQYILASQDAPEIVMHSRSDNWAPRWICGLEAALELTSIELSLSLARIYRSVSFPTRR